MSKRDVIKQPSHYVEGRKYEPKDVIRDWGLNFNLGNAVKYIARAGRKDDIVQDLKKAQEYIQFEIDAIEAERCKMKLPNHPNCKCGSIPQDDKMDAMIYGLELLRELPLGAGVDWSKADVIEVSVPVGAPPEEIIKKILDSIHEKAQKEEKQAEEPKESDNIVISLETLAGMTIKTFEEKYLKTKKVHNLEVTAGSKRYFVDTVDRTVENATGVFSIMSKPKQKMHIELKEKSSGGTIEINLEEK